MSAAQRAAIGKCSTDLSRLHEATDFIFASYAAGVSMAEIEIKIGVEEAGCLSGHLVSSPELMLRLSLAKIECANLLDREARAILKTAVGPVRSSHVRVATNLASSYSRAAEGERRNSEQMLRGNPMAIVEARATATTKAARKRQGTFAAFNPASAGTPNKFAAIAALRGPDLAAAAQAAGWAPQMPETQESQPATKFEAPPAMPERLTGLVFTMPGAAKPTIRPSEQYAAHDLDPSEVLARMSPTEFADARAKLKAAIRERKEAGEPTEPLRPLVDAMLAQIKHREAPAST